MEDSPGWSWLRLNLPDDLSERKARVGAGLTLGLCCVTPCGQMEGRVQQPNIGKLARPSESYKLAGVLGTLPASVK